MPSPAGMIHDGGKEAPEKVAELDRRYDEVMAAARSEYEYEPSSEYVLSLSGWSGLVL